MAYKKPALPEACLNLAVVDIECASLYSHTPILCVGIKPLGSEPYIMGLKDFPPVAGRNIDKHLVCATLDELERYDGYVTWNGLMFDIPMLDDRATMAGRKIHETRFHCDAMYLASWGKSRMQSRRLDWVAKQLGCPFVKTQLDINVWQDAIAESLLYANVGGSLDQLDKELSSRFKVGHKNYDYIVEHCLEDLKVTEWVFGRLKNRMRSMIKR